MFATSWPCTTTIFKKCHFLCVTYGQHFPICHVWVHTRWSILEDLHVCQSLQLISNTNTLQAVEAMHHTDFTNRWQFPFLSLVLPPGWGTRIFLSMSANHRQTNTVCNIVDHPSVHNTCIFFWTNTTSQTSTLCADTHEHTQHMVCASWPNNLTPSYNNPFTPTNNRQTNLNITHTHNTSHQTQHK